MFINRLTKKLDVEEEVERQAVEERQQGIRRQGRSVMSLEPGQLSTVENIEVRSLNEFVYMYTIYLLNFYIAVRGVV